MSRYHIVPAKDVADQKLSATDRILAILYDGVKDRIMPSVMNTVKDIPEDFIRELEEAGYRVEITDWSRTENQWRIFWDFDVYRTKEKEQKDAYLDRS